MIMFYEKSSFGWNSLNTYLNNTSLRCVKIDFDYHLSDEKRNSKNVIYYHKEDDYELHEGLLASPSKFSVRNMEREFLKYVNEDKQVGLVVCAGGIDCLLDVFIELAEKYQWYLHLIYLGEWEGTEVDHKGLLRIIKNADQYDSICFLNRYGMIDYNEKLEDVIAQITAYEELVSEDIAKILLKAQKLHKIQQSHKVNLYNHQKEVYELIKLEENEIIRHDSECFSIYEYVYGNDGKKVCSFLKELRKKYAKQYHEHLLEKPCRFEAECRGTCSVCENIAMNLWHKTKKPNAAYGKKIYAPVRGIERLRIQTDGEGVRTLIALNHCMLNCRYCINKQHINVFPFYKKVSVEQLGSMIEKDAVYFEMSNGGVTFGGGEPLLYADFIQAFHQQYPEWNIDVQTSLNVLAYDVEKLIDVVDVWHIDIKDLLDKNTKVKTSELDEWGNQFLEVLFGDKTIKNFNTGMFLEALAEEQDEDYHSLVCQRWNAIQAYYLGKVDDAIKLLEGALTQAKDESKPDWVIQDILIDLRNLHWVSNTEHNCFVESEAQKELNEFEEELYYPSLDRIHNSLQGKYIAGLYKKKIESPYSVTLGNDFNQYVELLASSFMVSIYNGSLTHILLFYDELRDFIFYLSSKYDDWNFRKDLLKYAVFKGSEKEIKGLQDAYPELLNMMTDKDAKEIIMFCANEPVRYKRFSSELLAMRAVGYYLNESDYSIYEKELLGKIQSWIENDSRTVINGQNIFLCLSGVGHRVAQDKLADICCSFMEHHFCHWYMDMFKFIAKTIDLNKLSNNLATRLIQDIISVMDNEQERQQVSYAPSFLLVFRKQNKDITEELDSKVAEVFPHYYNGDYLLGTQSEDEADYLAYISDYLEKIEENNLNQGKNGHYFGHGLREIATIRNILIGENIICPTEVMDKMISIVADTLLVSKEDIVTKFWYFQD